MKKGSYRIQEGCEGTKGGAGGGGGWDGGGGAQPADSSFSTCLLGLLFFFALCVVIMLAAWPWSSDKPQTTTPNEDGDRPEHEQFSGDKTTAGPAEKRTSEGRPTPPEERTATSTESTTSVEPPGEAELPSHETTREPGVDYDSEPVTRHPSKGGPTGPTKGNRTRPAKGGHHESEWVVDERGRGGKAEKEKLVVLEEDKPITSTVIPECTGKDCEGDKGAPPPHSTTADTEGSRVDTEAGMEVPPPHSTSPPHSSGTPPPTELTTVPSSAHQTSSTTATHAPTTAPPVHRDSTAAPSPPLGSNTVDTTEYSAVTEVSPAASNTAPPASKPPPVTAGVLLSAFTRTEAPDEETTISSVDSNPRVLKEAETPKDKRPLDAACESSVCKSLSARMLALMNHSADPCLDFYDYACGGMRSENSAWISEVAPASDAWTRISDMTHQIDPRSPMSHRKFKSFYDSCVFYDEHVRKDERIHQARDIIASVGRFYRSDEYTEGSGILTELIGRLLKYHFSPLLDILLDVDSSNSSKFVLKLTTPVFISPFGDSNGNEHINLSGWPKESCKQSATTKPEDGMKVDFNERYEAYAKCTVNYEQYIRYAEEAIHHLNVIQHLNETETPKLIRDSVIYMDLILGNVIPNILPKPGEKRQALLAKEFKKYTIKDLEKKFSLIDWKKLISMILDTEVPEDTIVQVYFESYFESLFPRLHDGTINERRVVNALMTMFTHELYYGLVMHRYPCNRESYCLKVARELMDDVSSALFLKSFGSGKLNMFHSLINNTFNELIMSLKSEISKISWMDGTSQISALEKVRNMKLFADGGASIFLNDTYLDSQFHELAMNSTYLENAVVLLQRYRKRMYKAYERNPSDPEQIWTHFLSPYDNLGRAIYGLNAIVVPYGTMPKPHFSEDYPKYVQMASLGHMLAHEIWHHFDSTGVLYDYNGLRRNLLSPESMSKMEALSKCIEEQYSAQGEDTDDEGRVFEYKLNPAVSLNERLADIGASHLAYKSLWGGFGSAPSEEPPLPWSSMTTQQLFFLSMAQKFCTKSSVYDYTVTIFESEHLPPFKRINDIVFNSREFAVAFECPAPSAPRCDPFNMAA